MICLQIACVSGLAELANLAARDAIYSLEHWKIPAFGRFLREKQDTGFEPRAL
jgi:hypothetical protein